MSSSFPLSSQSDQERMHAVGWTLWAMLTYSYPLLALFGESGSEGGGISLVVIPAIMALCVSGVLGFASSDARHRVALLLIALMIGSVNIYVYLSDSTMLVSKFQQFNLVLALFGVITACTFLADKILERLDIALMITGVIGLFALLFNTSQYDAGRFTYGDSNPIWMGRILGFACVGAAYRALINQKYMMHLAPLGLILLLGIVITGSRGPLLSVFLAIVAGMLFYRFEHKWRWISLSVVGFVFLSIVIQLLDNLDGARGLTLGQADDVSYFIRISVFDYAVGLIDRYPSGIGVGNFFFYGFPYPHNIFLELLAEWGWLFGGFYIFFIAVGAAGLFFAGQRYQLLLMILVFDIANASVSGDITSPRYLYALVMFGWAHLVVQAYVKLSPGRGKARYRDASMGGRPAG